MQLCHLGLNKSTRTGVFWKLCCSLNGNSELGSALSKGATLKSPLFSGLTLWPKLCLVCYCYHLMLFMHCCLHAVIVPLLFPPHGDFLFALFCPILFWCCCRTLWDVSLFPVPLCMTTKGQCKAKLYFLSLWHRKNERKKKKKSKGKRRKINEWAYECHIWNYNNRNIGTLSHKCDKLPATTFFRFL